MYTCTCTHIYRSMYTYIYISIHMKLERHLEPIAKQLDKHATHHIIYTHIRIYLIWSKETPLPRGGFLFTIFSHQEPWVRGPPSKNLYQVLRRGSSYSGFLMRDHNKYETPRGGGVAFAQIIHAYIYPWNMHSCIHICVHTHTHTRIYMYIYTNMHT